MWHLDDRLSHQVTVGRVVDPTLGELRLPKYSRVSELIVIILVRANVFIIFKAFDLDELLRGGSLRCALH